MRRFLILFPGGLGLLVVFALLLPLGEVVDLETVDAEGRPHHSALWVADLDGTLHLRAGRPDAAWLARLATHPLVVLERDDRERHYRATASADPGVRAALNEALAAKYGVADRLIGRFIDLGEAVPVRLEPVGGLDDHDH